jgi:tetratricopeptide (TPR) repeat protein
MKGRVRKTAASPQPQTQRAVREVAARLWLVVDKDKGEGPKDKIVARLNGLAAATETENDGSGRVFDEVIAACNQAIALEPDFSFSYLMRAAAKTDLGRFGEALEDCNRAINLIGTEGHKENEASAYVMRAQVFRKLHELDKALDDCERAIGLTPNDGWPHLVRGLTLKNAGRIDEYIDEITLSRSFYPNDVIIIRDDDIWTVPREKFGESKTPGYPFKGREDRQSTVDLPPGVMSDAEHDLNALAANLGLSFEEAAAKLTAGKKPRALSSDPLSVARRVVRRYQRRRAKDPNFPASAEVLAAFRVISKGNYPGVKANRAAKKSLAM